MRRGSTTTRRRVNPQWLLWALVLAAQPLAHARAAGQNADAVTRPAAQKPAAGARPTLEVVRKGIVGTWNCTQAPCEGAVVAFSASGQITQEGFLSDDGRVLGFEGNSRYRLSANPKGPGIVIMRVIKSGKAFPMYLVEAMDADTISMRTLEASPHFSEGATSLVKWKRLKQKD